MSSAKSDPLRCQGYTVPPCFPVRFIEHELRRHQPPQNIWSSNICHCFDHPSSCWTTFFCPCVTFGRIAVFADEGNSSCVAKGALYCLAAALTGCFLGGACCCGCYYRGRLRTRFMWKQSACHDSCVHCCCHCCALCQEYRQLQSLGYDPRKGTKEQE
ncbi:cell number regulator 2-like [Rhodamnia argentea]|uniref:Cell number regulator 2-like n=1 Tax=Rhodamnia argentea TaxID=178133 RepID=A0ABM3H9B5_9MYRT|nr:cell number regulator 2-like [Rhodamnia argentea]